MKRSVIFTVILLFTCFSRAQSCPQFAYGGELPKTAEPHIVICKKEFAVGYSTTKKNPLWVAQRLDPEKLTSQTVIESAPFKPDPLVDKAIQPALSDFVGSNMDRGHMAPFEDNNHDVIAGAESMYLTNIVPQNSSNNRGIWRVLEAATRERSLNGVIYVITGPIFAANPPTIGTGKIPVPEKLFKVIIDPQSKKTLTYIIPNEATASSLLPSFVTTRQVLTELSSIDVVPIASLQDSK